MIVVEELHKEYRVAIHHPGFWGAFRNLVEHRYDVVRAVDGISFEIAKGEFVGFIGPNGAGKSTTIKVLTGVLEPTSGSVRVSGREPRAERIEHVSSIGVVFGQRTQLWWDLPVIESYGLLRSIYAIRAAEYGEQLERLVSMLEIEALLHTPVRKLSLGQRMRCELVAALLHSPPLLFLDEPTIGLDVVAKETIRAFLAAENRDRQTTILLATHDLVDIERLCRRMLLIDRGRVVYDGEFSAIRRRFGASRRMRVEFDGPAPESLPDGVVVEERAPERLTLRFRRDTIPSGELVSWLSARTSILDLAIEELPIERIVAAIYRDGLDASGDDIDSASKLS